MKHSNEAKHKMVIISLITLIVIFVTVMRQMMGSTKGKTIQTNKTIEVKTIRMKVTAYCPCKKCCGEYADEKTATGHNAKKTLGIAADPTLLPYGTKLKIPGIGIRIVDDTGGAMRKSAKEGIYHIDVRFHNHEKAKKFGVHWLDVKVL